jgi:hypothetical protein
MERKHVREKLLGTMVGKSLAAGNEESRRQKKRNKEGKFLFLFCNI